MQAAYAPYRAALFRTNSKAQAESEQAIAQARQAWADRRSAAADSRRRPTTATRPSPARWPRWRPVAAAAERGPATAPPQARETRD